MDMILDSIAPPGETISIQMSDGNAYIGSFQSHTFPFSNFKTDTGLTIYIQREQICSVQPLGQVIVDGNPNASPGEVRNLLGKHSAKALGEA